MKHARFLLLALIASCALPSRAAEPTAKLVEQWQKAAVQKHPSLATAGSALNQRFLAIVAGKRTSDTAFFAAPDWPMRAAEAAAAELKAEETAAKEKAKAEMERTETERARAEEIAEWEREWEGERKRWVFDRLVFGDKEEVVVRKLNLSKLVTARAAPGGRVALSSRFRWVIGESKFNMDFEMKDGLAAITFECLPEDVGDLDSLIHEDWERLRTATIELFGQPVRSVTFPKAERLTRGGLTETDAWEQPARQVTLGISEDEGKCTATLRINSPRSSPAAK